jgi:hypothetical protein
MQHINVSLDFQADSHILLFQSSSKNDISSYCSLRKNEINSKMFLATEGKKPRRFWKPSGFVLNQKKIITLSKITA